MAVVCCQSFESIACIGFLYVLMRECQASAGFAIYNARSIGQESANFVFLLRQESEVAGFKLHVHWAAEGVDNV